MKFQLATGQLMQVLKQRNRMIFFCIMLLMANVMQSAVLLLKSDHIIVVPPEIRQSFWIERNRVSAAYLEEMAVFLIQFFLSVSPASFAYQRDILLRYAEPASYSMLKAQLLDDEARLKKGNISTSFRPVEVHVHPTTLKVNIVGDLMTYVSDKRISQVRETYTFQFKFRRGELQIQSFGKGLSS